MQLGSPCNTPFAAHWRTSSGSGTSGLVWSGGPSHWAPSVPIIPEELSLLGDQLPKLDVAMGASNIQIEVLFRQTTLETDPQMRHGGRKLKEFGLK